jgi:hypothetical protein
MAGPLPMTAPRQRLWTGIALSPRPSLPGQAVDPEKPMLRRILGMSINKSGILLIVIFASLPRFHVASQQPALRDVPPTPRLPLAAASNCCSPSASRAIRPIFASRRETLFMTHRSLTLSPDHEPL